MSSKTRANDFALEGVFSILRGGFTFFPSQAYSLGIFPPFSKAGLDIFNASVFVTVWPMA
jgi:hypothetical protein